MTEYVVLLQDENDPETFHFLGVNDVAYGPSQLIRNAAGLTAEDADDTFIVVPTRNWNVVHRRIETPPPIRRVEEEANETFLARLARAHRLAERAEQPEEVAE